MNIIHVRDNENPTVKCARCGKTSDLRSACESGWYPPEQGYGPFCPDHVDQLWDRLVEGEDVPDADIEAALAKLPFAH